MAMMAAAAAELVREKAKTAKEEPAVTSKPLSAVFLEHCFNVALLSIIAYYIVIVYFLQKYCDSKWMLLGLIAVVTPCYGLMLYAVLLLKGEHTEKFAMAHLDAQVPGKAPAAGNV